MKRNFSFDSTCLEIESTKDFGQIEVGGPFVGAEFHKNAVFPNRLSFFYPLANSIDTSGDYWHRDLSRNLFLGVKIGAKPWTVIEKASAYRLSPYAVTFFRNDEDLEATIEYSFCRNKPAMVMRIELLNAGQKPMSLEAISCLRAALRTSSTYTPKSKSWTAFEKAGSTIFVNNVDSETGMVQLFVTNAGELPVGFSTTEQHSPIPNSNGTFQTTESKKCQEGPENVIFRMISFRNPSLRTLLSPITSEKSLPHVRR